MYMANSSGMKKYICSSSGAGSFAPVLKISFQVFGGGVEMQKLSDSSKVKVILLFK